MGYIRDEAIVVTASPGACDLARSKAIELGLRASGAVVHQINDQATFVIVPDGSKEGWKDSDDGDRARLEWKTWAKSVYGTTIADVRAFLHWVHVSYDEDGHSYIVENWATSSRDD